MIKVAFDFDDTLDQDEVQEYAKSLIERGIDVWICTARLDNHHGNPNWNIDLFETAMSLRIPFGNIIMTNLSLKSAHLNKKGFTWLLDDMQSNIEDLMTSDCIPILYVHYNNWKEKCEKLINQHL
jgi:hypothetical protein